MAEGRKRIEFIDIAKGLGMFAVIWGHILTSGPSFVLVYAFDIPLFFFMSGMMFKKEKYRSLGSFVISRAKSLLLPYVIFSVATWLVWAAYSLIGHSNANLWKPLWQTVAAQGSGGYLVHDVPLWFVTCLFVVEILYFFISKLPDVFNLLICVVMAGIGHWMLHNSLAFDFTKLPWNIEAAMSAMLFYCLGNLFVKHFDLKKTVERCEKHRWLCLGIAAVGIGVFAAGALWNGHVTLGSNDLGKNTLVFYAVGLLGTAIALLLSILFGLIKEKAVLKSIYEGVRWVGRNSFYFMAIHVPIKGFLIVILAKLLHTTSVKVSECEWQSAIVFVLTVFCSSVVVAIINKVKSLTKKEKE